MQKDVWLAMAGEKEPGAHVACIRRRRTLKKKKTNERPTAIVGHGWRRCMRRRRNEPLCGSLYLYLYLYSRDAAALNLNLKKSGHAQWQCIALQGKGQCLGR